MPKNTDKQIEVTFLLEDLTELKTVFSKNEVATQLNRRVRDQAPDHVWEDVSDDDFISHVTAYLTRSTERQFIPMNSNYDEGGTFIRWDQVVRVDIGQLTDVGGLVA